MSEPYYKTPRGSACRENIVMKHKHHVLKREQIKGREDEVNLKGKIMKH